MHIKTILAIFTFLCALSVGGYAQYSPTADQVRQQQEERRRQEIIELRIRSAMLDNLQRRYAPNRSTFKRASLSKEERELRDKLVAPNSEDLILVKDFLKQPKTGIFRLFPDNDCFANNVVKVDGKCENTVPNIWYYSFRKNDYSNGMFFDILLKNGSLITDGFLAQGILVKLGNFSLDRVSLEGKGAKFLVNFKPAEKTSDIKVQYDELDRGIESEGFKYSHSAKAEVGGVYLMRVIAYRAQKKSLNKILKNSPLESKSNFEMLEKDERKDITIAFRIIREEINGNLTIIWKELERKESPEVTFLDK